jgi:hypothetical protein
MKSTDLNRRDREIKKSRKKEELIQKKVEKRDERSVGEFIKKLFSLFYFDEQKIYNLESDEIMELLEEVQIAMPEKQWDNILRKAIRKTKIKEREEAFKHLRGLMTD